MSLLKVERLSKSFGASCAVDSISFEVRNGVIKRLMVHPATRLKHNGYSFV